jgi:hypothetical protein
MEQKCIRRGYMGGTYFSLVKRSIAYSISGFWSCSRYMLKYGAGPPYYLILDPFSLIASSEVHKSDLSTELNIIKK